MLIGWFFCAMLLTRAVLAARHGASRGVRCASVIVDALEQRAPSPRVSELCTTIASLSLLETADLVKLLRERLNIQEVVPAVAVAAGPASPAADEPAADKPKEAEKTLFNLTLKSFDAAAKAKLIREIKSLLNLGLVEAKAFVEAAPKMVQENMKKDDAEKMKKTLEDLGAVVELS